MRQQLTRRELLISSLASGACVVYRQSSSAQPAVISKSATLNAQRIRGLLLGSMIGDALGGPIEFQKSSEVADLVINCRGWPSDRQLSRNDLSEFARSLKLISYQRCRPKPEPYGQWQANALPGTVTDDTRHKMVLMAALREAEQDARNRLTGRDLAQAYLDYADLQAIRKRPEYESLCEESFREFWQSARWVLGERDLKLSAPPDRIWGGTPTCCGQMTMLPLAAVYVGQPVAAYRATYEASFFDVGPAKDINSAIVAGLSIALLQPKPTDRESRRSAWLAIIESMRQTDPYRYSEVPFAERPIARWLGFASRAVRDAGGSPKRLYEILLKEGQVKYFWESHFILALVFSTMELCDYDSLAAMAMILDFGHDTDSGAQLLGAFAGAIHGSDIFAPELQRPVIERLEADYGVSIDEWVKLLLKRNQSRQQIE